MMNYEMVLIESSKRSQGTSTQFQFKLPKPARDVYKIDLLYASLNNTFYTFTSMDNFKFVESFPARMTSVIIPAYNETIITYDDLDLLHMIPINTVVNYPERIEQQMIKPPDIPLNSSLYVDEFVLFIKTNMNNISSSKNYIVSYDPSNFKLKISNSDTSNELFSLDFLQD